MVDEYHFDLKVDFAKDGNAHLDFMNRLLAVGYNAPPAAQQ
jgi:hypothetical protein